MSASGPSPLATLVSDNSLLVMLCDYFCERLSVRFSGARLVEETKARITDQLNILKQFAQKGYIHCTDSVAAEFKPHAGRLSSKSGITHSLCRTLERHVCGLLYCATISLNDINTLRSLPTAPRRLVGPNGLSDGDFSLVVLALQLAVNERPVYILTNDADLLRFVTWVRTRPQARTLWGDPSLIEGLHCLHYLELIHRDCRIKTDEMADLLKFATIEHYTRTELTGTDKGTWIMQRLLDIRDAMHQSMTEKLARGEAT